MSSGRSDLSDSAISRVKLFPDQVKARWIHFSFSSGLSPGVTWSDDELWSDTGPYMQRASPIRTSVERTVASATTGTTSDGGCDSTDMADRTHFFVRGPLIGYSALRYIFGASGRTSVILRPNLTVRV